MSCISFTISVGIFLNWQFNKLLKLVLDLVNAGQNKQHAPTRNTAKLDRETEELKHKSIDNNVARYIQQGRQAKGLSQKDLATKINEKPQIINDYEAGRGIPNNIILGKMERVLSIKLRGKDIGQPVAPPAPKK